jgi:hypothetical protein
MSKDFIRNLLALTLLAACAASGWAQSASVSVAVPPPAGAKAAQPPSAFDKFANELKKPADWLSWGADLRVRNEYMDNIVSLTEADLLSEQDVIRIRGRIWASVTPVSNLSLNVRFSGEPRDWIDPAFVGQHKKRTGMEWRYGIFDNLYLKWTNAFSLPLTVTAGRQDIMLGDYWNWWLMADGTPGDGSWAFFFDSIRLTYDIKDIKTKVDVMYIYHNALPDEWIPTLGRSGAFTPPYILTEQNEQGVVLYLSNKSIPNTQIDPYFFYKRDNAELKNGDDADIYTIGTRITGTPAEHWSYSVEGAYQFGQKQDPTVKVPVARAHERDIDAFGGNARLSYLCKDSINNQFHLVYEYLSGDDPNTDRDEMFDILWGRWPRLSELYLYSYIYETSGKVAQWNNLHRFGGGWTMTPLNGMHLGVYYNALFAPEKIPTRTVNPSLFTMDGDFRGHYLQAVLKHQFNKHLAGHLWGEWIWAGDYYATRDLLTFIRAELLFTF